MPRQMPKRIIVEDSSSVVSPTPKDLQSAFPSQFYNSCPLFSVPGKKEEAICRLPTNEDVSMKETETVPAGASIPCADEYKVVQREAPSPNSPDDTCLKPEFQVDDGRSISCCQGSTDKAVSQNVRSKDQILALLIKEHKDFSAPPMKNATSVKNLALQSVRLDSHQEGLSFYEPSRTIDSSFRQKTEYLLGSTNNTIQKNTEYGQLLYSSERNVQTKSRWDAYLPSCVADESSNVDDAEKNVSDLQPVLKDLKENAVVNQYSKNQRIIPQVSSLEISVSPISKGSVKNQQHSFISTESIKDRSDTEVTPSFDCSNYLEYISASKTLEDELSKASSKHMMHDELAKSGNESQNVSYPTGSSQCFSNGSICGDLSDPNKQLMEVNFNLLETVDFSDTEDEELLVNNMVSQGSKSFEEDSEMPLEVSVEKNHRAKICSIGKKGTVQPALQQDKDVSYISGSQTLQLCDEFHEKPGKVKESGPVLPFVKKARPSEASAAAEKRDTSAAVIQNVCAHRSVCICTDLLREDDVSCKVTQTMDLAKMSMIPHVFPASSICFVDKNNEKDMEIQENNAPPSSRDTCGSMKSINLSLAFTSNSDGVSQYVPQDHYFAPAENHKLDFRSTKDSLNSQTSDEFQMSKNELADSINTRFLNKSDDNKKDNFVCVKPSVNSLNLASLTNGFRLLNSLTEHSTALEGLQTIEENTGILLEKEGRRKQCDSVGTEGY